MKPWLFAILIVAAIGLVLHDPDGKAEGNSVVSSVSDTFDPYLQQGLSGDTHDAIKERTDSAAAWVKTTGSEFGLDFTFSANH